MSLLWRAAAVVWRAKKVAGAGMPHSERDLLFCKVVTCCFPIRKNNPLWYAKVKKTNIPDGSRNA